MAQQQNSGAHSHPHPRTGPSIESKDGAAATAAASETFQCCKDPDHNHTGANDPHRRGSAWNLTNMPKEIAEVAIDQMITIDTKREDMLRHSRDESLDAFQRALLCLKSQEINQKIFAAHNLFTLILQDEAKAFKDILPAIEAELIKNSDPEYHEAAANGMTKAIVELLKKNPARGKQLVNIAANFATSENSDVSEKWSKCFETLVEKLESADLQRELVPHITGTFGKENSTQNGKKVAARLIHKLAQKVPEEVVAKRLFPVVEILCRDKDPIVRREMCFGIAEVVAKLKKKESVFSLLQNFATDDDPTLIAALTSALGKSVTLINPKDPQTNALYQIAIPILKKLVKKAYVEGHVNILTEFSAHMGQITWIFSGAGVLAPGDKLWFLDAFLQLSRYGLPPTFQRNHAQDMPTGFLNFRANMEFNKRHSLIESLIGTGAHAHSTGAGASQASTLALLKGNNNNMNSKGTANPHPHQHHNLGAEQVGDGWICRANAAKEFLYFVKFAKPLVDFKNGLHPMMVDLMHDPVPAVRIRMAEHVFNIMQFLGSEGAILHGEVVYALSDDNVSVIEAILPHLAEILKHLVQSKLISPEMLTNTTVEIGGALLFCEERLSQTNDWRVHATMLEQLAVLPFCLPGDYVYSNFVPALFHRLLHMRQLPCRVAAGDAIVSFLRHCKRSQQRDDIQRRIKEGFAQGRSVHDRMLFLFMSKKIMEMFSRKYYRDNFFETTLALTDDTVANIRLKAVNMMPDLKGVLQMSEDRSLLRKLEDTLQRIKSSETDRDVQNAIDAVIPEMAKIGVVLKNDKKGNATQEDLEDQAKEREEAYIQSLEPQGGPPNVKERRRSLFKTSKRNSDPKLTLPPPPRSGTKINPNSLVNPTESNDNTKLALQMKPNQKPTAQNQPAGTKKSLPPVQPTAAPNNKPTERKSVGNETKKKSVGQIKPVVPAPVPNKK